MKYFNTYLLYPLLEKMQKRDILSKISSFKNLDLKNRSDKNKITKNMLYIILKEANLYVPYYRDLFKEFSFNPKEILDDINNLNKLPYLTKDIIQREGPRLIDERYKDKLLHERKTGGSTGTSTLIYYSQDALDWTAASNLHAISWTGKKRHFKEIHLSSYFPETFPMQDRIKEYIKCNALNRTNLTTHSFDDINMEEIFHKIKKANVYYVEGHPSTLYSLAMYIKRVVPTFIKPLFNVFESTGEVLDEVKRVAIEEYIGCKVYDRYGNAEFGVIAHETDNSNHSLKVIDFMVYPEVLDYKQVDKEHSFKRNREGEILFLPTIKLDKIWKSRPDLQSVLPYGLTAQSVELWKWWLGWGSKEYKAKSILPQELMHMSITEHLKEFLIEVIWKNREDLQKVFPNTLGNNVPFLEWWKVHGLKEYIYEEVQEEKYSELVLTTLTNNAMPLIRYRMGDLIESLDEKDDGFYISNIQGRLHDLITIDDKVYPTHYVQDLLDRVGSIIEFQIEMTDDNTILSLVVDDITQNNRIKEKLESWWKSVDIQFIELHQLKKVGWRDKFRYVIDSRTKK